MGKKRASTENEMDDISSDYETRSSSARRSKQKNDSAKFRDPDIKDVPSNKHGCTDIICTIIFFIFIIALILLSIFAYKNGSPSDLIRPHDSAGRICGVSSGVENKPYLLFYDLTRCLSITSALTGCPTPQICVDKCPDRYAYNKIPFDQDYLKEFCDPLNKNSCPTYLLSSDVFLRRCLPKILVDSLSTATDVLQAFDPNSNKSVTIEVESNNGQLVDLTVGTLKKSAEYLKNLLNLKKRFELAYEDFSKSYGLILIGLAVGALVSFLWICLLRFVIAPVVYVTIVASLLALAYATYFCYHQYFKLKSKNINTDNPKLNYEKFFDFDYVISLKETWLGFSIALSIVLVILLLIVIFLRKRIKFAIKIIQEVSKAILKIPVALVWPLVPFLIQLGIIAYCVSTALYLASAGIPLYKIIDTNVTNQESLKTYELKIFGKAELSKVSVGDYCIPDVFNEIKNSTDDPQYATLECVFYQFGFNDSMPFGLNSSLSSYYAKAIDILFNYQVIFQIYIAFMFFWLTAFVIGLNSMTLAGSFGQWYWCSGANKSIPLFTVFSSFGRAIFYHFGTIAFGSLLIAIIKLIRLILEYIDRKVKSKTDNKIVAFVLCCMKCCFWCLEKFIKFISRWAFIVTAVYSLNFCRAAQKSFKLIATNALRVVVIDNLTSFILFLSSLFITAVIGVIAFYFFTGGFDIESLNKYTDLNYYILPVIVIIVGVYAITRLFFDVFSMGVDSILMCVLIDLNINNGSKSNPYYMSKSLKKLLL